MMGRERPWEGRGAPLVLTLVLALMAVVGLLAGCGSDSPPESAIDRFNRTTVSEIAAPQSLRLTEADHGASFEIQAGGLIELVLRTDPSTGYYWASDDPEPEASLLEQAAEPLFVPDDPEAANKPEVADNPEVADDPEAADDTPLAEGPGTLTFSFRAVDKGEMVVRFVYLGPEVDEEPAKIFEINLVVR